MLHPSFERRAWSLSFFLPTNKISTNISIPKKKKKILYKPYTALTLFKAPIGWIVLEIVVERATGLKSVHLFHNLKPYPVVSICDANDNYYYDSQNNKPVDLNGRSNPKWGAFFEFNIDIDEALQKRLLLIVRLESHRNTYLGSKFIGEVRVPIEELLKDFGDADDKKSVTRSVLNKKEEAQGSLTFTYKFGRTLDHPPAALPQPAHGNPVAQIPQRYNDGNPIFRAAVGGTTSGLVNSLSDLVLDSL